MVDVLPDSRLKDPKATVMYDWEVGFKWRFRNGCFIMVPKIVRLEMEPIFCINCPKQQGYVPRNCGISFVSWMCAPCSEKYGKTAAESESSDREFWRKVNDAMVRKFGRALTGEELDKMAAQGRLGRELELLDRESPYKGARQ